MVFDLLWVLQVAEVFFWAATRLPSSVVLQTLPSERRASWATCGQCLPNWIVAGNHAGIGLADGSFSGSISVFYQRE